MWYHLKPYVLVAAGVLVIFNSGWPGVFAGSFAVMMGLVVFRLRGTL